MDDTQKILETLDEIKMALKALYGDAKNQDTMIDHLERAITSNLQNELSKVSSSLDLLQKLTRSVDDITSKLESLSKINDAVSKMSATLAKLDVYQLQEDIELIKSDLVSFDGRLTSIARK